MSLVDVAQRKYKEGYNCAEAILQACNEYYDLGMSENEMKMMAGFGGGMFTGNACGALSGSVAAISKKIIDTKAHDHLDEIRPATQKVVANFNKTLGHTQCAQLKKKYHNKEQKCLQTVTLAAQSLEEVFPK